MNSSSTIGVSGCIILLSTIRAVWQLQIGAVMERSSPIRRLAHAHGLAIGLLASILVACGGVTSTPTATLAPRPTDPPLVSETTGAPTSIAPAPTTSPTEPIALDPTSTAQPNTLQTLKITSLERYNYQNGLFTIEVPVGWQITEDPGEMISVTWVAPQGNSGIFVGLRQMTETLSSQQLAEFCQTYVQSVFGSENNFEMRDPREQGDGSMSVGFRITTNIGGGDIDLLGLTFVEQRGDKLSALTILVPLDNTDPELESTFQTIINSYKIDADVAIP
jgi:hypothetical protein